MPHLIKTKTITSLEPKPFGEVGGGRPLQLCRWTYFAKIKSKRIIAEKRPKFNKKINVSLHWMLALSLSILGHFPQISAILKQYLSWKAQKAETLNVEDENTLCNWNMM